MLAVLSLVVTARGLLGLGDDGVIDGDIQTVFSIVIGIPLLIASLVILILRAFHLDNQSLSFRLLAGAGFLFWILLNVEATPSNHHTGWLSGLVIGGLFLAGWFGMGRSGRESTDL